MSEYNVETNNSEANNVNKKNKFKSNIKMEDFINVLQYSSLLKKKESTNAVDYSTLFEKDTMNYNILI